MSAQDLEAQGKDLVRKALGHKRLLSFVTMQGPQEDS